MSPEAGGRPVATGVCARTTPNVIWEALDLKRDNHAQLFCWDAGTYRPTTWDMWREGAEHAGIGLRKRGIEPGARIGAVLTNTFDVCAAIIGAWLVGGVVLSFPTLRRGMDASEYVEQLRDLCCRSGAEMLLLEDQFLALLTGRDFGVPVHSFASLRDPGTLEPSPPADGDLAFVQYSSGSTSDPKGCLLTMGAISEQERMLMSRLETDGESRGVTWLPLSHDMGLFGCLLLSWASGMRLAVGSPERFLRKPHTWMDDCVDFAATITVTPNFGLALATRKARERPPKGHIPMRTVVLGGERIEWRTLTEADDVLGPFGVSLQTLTPAYGLAEATLAVSMKHLGDTPHVVGIDAERSYAGELELLEPSDPRRKSIVACGPPMRNIAVRTTNPGGVGRICVRSTALATGYLDQPHASAKTFTADGECITDDLGFVRDGELYVIGRTDDVIVIAGRNLHARDVEVAVEQCPGVRPGCSSLVDVPLEDSSRLVLLAEIAPEHDDLVALADAMASAAFRASGARISECVFLRSGMLPKTPSGKVQRFRARGLVTGGSSAVLEKVAV